MFNEERFEKLCRELTGSTTMAGEMIRAVCYLRDRYYNHNEFIGIEKGNETCNGPARYLKVHGGYEIKDILCDMWGLSSQRFYEAILDTLTEKVCIYIERHPNLRSMWTESMFDYKLKEDFQWADHPEEDWDQFINDFITGKRKVEAWD